MIIAVDFDGTLCVSNWPRIGEPNYDVIERLKTHQLMGDKLILWTCRSGQKLEEAILWCHKFGLEFDAVNDNLPEHIQYFGDNSRKIYADEYWDDKAVVISTSANGVFHE